MSEPLPMFLDGLLGCKRCPISETRFRVVPGYGNHNARIMIVGQSPGHEEDSKGRPFVGDSGQFLATTLKSLGLDLDRDCFRTNANHCHTPLNREATRAEMSACKPFLDEEIAAVDPVIILTMGGSALKMLLPGESSAITQVRGHVYQRELGGKLRYVMPTLHPAYVMRNPPAYQPLMRTDLRLAVEIARTGTYTTKALPFRKHAATLEEIFAAIKAPVFGFDLETDTGNGADDDGNELYDNDQGLRGARITGVGVCAEPGNGLYYTFESDEEAEQIITRMKPQLESLTQLKIVSNAKFERHICHSYGINFQNWDDTMLEAWVAGDYPLGLKDGFHHATGIEMIRIDKFKKLGYKRKDSTTGKYVVDMRAAQDADPVAVAEYAAQDPDASLRLHFVLEKLLKARVSPIAESTLWNLYREIEVPFNDIVVEIERNGFLFDPAELTGAAASLATGLAQVTAEITQMLGHPINAGSWQQVQKALYETVTPYQIPKFKVTRSQPKAMPTDKVSLAPYSSNPLVRAILTSKAITKMQGTYIEALPKWQDHTGRIHSELKQASVSTGRLSSANPNQTNIPARKRDDLSVVVDGSLIRRAFIAPPGSKICAADLSQIEMRVAADRSGDPAMIRELQKGGDIHGNTARTIYRTNEETVGKDVWKSYRNLAKTVGFGCVPMGTQALTPDGWKHYEDLEVGGVVLGYNQATNTTEWTEILEKIYYPSAPLVRMSNDYWSAVSTPTHRWYGTRRTSDGKTKFSIPDTFTTEQIRTEHTITLTAPLRDDSYAGNLTPTEAAIIGWLLTDGSFHWNAPLTGATSQAGGRRRQIKAEIYQSKQAGLDSLRSLLADVPHTDFVRDREGIMQQHVFRLAPQYARDLWYRSDLETLTYTEFVLQLDTDARAAFLQAVIQAEGTPVLDTYTITQNQGPKMDAIRLAIFLEGYVPSISDNGAYKDNLSQKTRMCKPYVTGQRIVKTDLAPAPVWCLRTNLGSWVMQQNGIPTITGNSLYGLAGAGLLKRTPTLGLTMEEANAFIDGFYATYPKLRTWQESVRVFTRRNGYAETILGRRRYFPDITSRDFDRRGEAERGAINHPIQGSAADFFKIATQKVYNFLLATEAQSKIVALVHDEIVFEAPDDEVKWLSKTIPSLMASAITLAVPVFVDFEFGQSWGDVHEYSEKWPWPVDNSL